MNGFLIFDLQVLIELFAFVHVVSWIVAGFVPKPEHPIH